MEQYEVVLGRVVGREAELAAVEELLEGVAAGPATLALWGEAGIGKTTVWKAGVDSARSRGYAVFACRPAASEVRLSYAGLADLLEDVGAEIVESLPRTQRRALDAALLRSADDDHAPDPRAVAAGFLSVLNGVAVVSPVLVAIDDLQWLDEPTHRVVGFAVRRCRGPVATLTAERSDAEDHHDDDLRPPDPARLRRLQLSALSLGALHHVVRQETGHSFPRPVMVRIAELSGGNPFYALEIAQSVQVRGSGAAEFPRSLTMVVRDRLGSLSRPVREALLVTSALADPRLEVVGRACGGVDVPTLLAPAEDSGVVEVSGGRVRFTHPLLASAVYTDASPTRRRALHRQLSGLVVDVEERARHLALAATGFDADTVSALDAAAERARRRGAASAAAELLEQAIELGAGDPSRRIQAARDHFDADNQARARELLEGTIADLGPGPPRAEALGLLGTIVYETQDFGRAIEVLERAFTEAENDPRLRSSIALELGVALPNGGRVADALPYAKIAVDEAGKLDDDGLLAEALGSWVIVRFLSGQGVDQASLGRALALEDPERRSHAVHWPSLNATLVYLWSHQLDRARAGLAALEQRCVERGAESDLWFVLGHAITADLSSGDVESARRHTAEMGERARMAGSEQVGVLALAARAILEAWTGEIDRARATGEQAMAGLSESFAAASLFAAAALGMVELSVGDHAAAARWLGPAANLMMAMGLAEPAVVPFLPDAAEALIASDRLDEARPIAERLEASGRNPGRAWAEAVGARCRGLLLAAEGKLDEALAAFDRALAAHERLPLRYDKARTLLAAGRLQRRRNERRSAKASLEEAARLFDEVGAAQWGATARAELDRLGLHPGPPDQLTPTEERIALLAASGMTNREVAAKLSVSPKTVEANLSRAYRKLGIHSRAELGRWMAGRPTGDQPAET